MKKLLVLLVLGVSSVGFSTVLEPGSYYAQNGYYFSRVRVTQWANELLLEGCLKYGGSCAPFTLRLYDRGPAGEFERYSGNGTMSIRYVGQTNFVCDYPLSTEIFAQGNHFYVRSTHQATICSTNCFRCEPARLETREHKTPYVKTGN